MPLEPHSKDGHGPSQTGTNTTPAAPVFPAQKVWPTEESTGHQMTMLPEQSAQAAPPEDRSEPISRMWDRRYSAPFDRFELHLGHPNNHDREHHRVCTAAEVKNASRSITTRNADSFDDAPQPAERMKANTHSSAPSFHLCNVPKTLLHSDTVEQEIPATLGLDLLATVCRAESGSIAAFGTGNANGHNIERLELSTGKAELDGADESSKLPSHLSFVPYFGFAFLVLISGMLKYKFDAPNPVLTYLTLGTPKPGLDSADQIEMNRILNASEPISISESLPEIDSQLPFWLSPVCLIGAFGCWYLPVRSKALLRKLNLDLSDHRDGVAADTYLILAYIYVVIPLFQLACARLI